MSTPITIKDGTGSRHKAAVTDNNAVKIMVSPFDSCYYNNNELTTNKQFISLFIDANNSSAMNIDGYSSPTDFSIKSQLNVNIFITGFRIILNSTHMNISSNDIGIFGSVGQELQNGISCFISQGGIVTYLFVNNIKKIGDFLNYTNQYINLTGPIPVDIDYLNFDYSFDTPIVIPNGNKDNITIRIQDDLSSLSLFNIIARGYQQIC